MANGEWRGAVRTSVTLLGQDMGNTYRVNGYTFSVLCEVLFGQIAALFIVLSKRLSARIKLLVIKSTWPSSKRPNQTSMSSALIGLSPTDHPARALLKKRRSPSSWIIPRGLTRREHIWGYSKSSGVPSYLRGDET